MFIASYQGVIIAAAHSRARGIVEPSWLEIVCVHQSPGTGVYLRNIDEVS